MARKVVRRLTAPVYGPAGELLYQAGEVVPLDASLGPDYRTVLDEVDVPDPEPQAAPEPPPADVPSSGGRRHATVNPEPAAGKGAAHK